MPPAIPSNPLAGAASGPASSAPLPVGQRRLALVTGGARRLGRAVVEALAQAGHDCAIHVNTSRAEGETLAADLRRLGLQAQVLELALTEPVSAAAALLDTCEKAFGRLPQASVLCAASYDLDDALAPNPVLLQQQLALNYLFPVQYCAQLAARLAARAQTQVPAQTGVAVGAAVGVVESAPTQAGYVDHSVTLFTDYKVQRVNRDFFSYSLAKHALEGSLPYLAVAYAPWLRVNAIAPGPVLAAHGMSQAELDRRVDAESATGRHPTASDIARSAVYLASTPSLVGQHICVDAGARFDARAREVCLVP
jgi:NAD(P)-dependent dehydrogenase (short-subunit alcohol dehydrogenase family)